MSSSLSKTKLTRITVTETKTVAQLLAELELSNDHVVLIDGKKMGLDDVLQENDSIIILPLIAGGL
ncbi:MAG: MoaD/ThiS family protein [Candidatus Thorarchaeota archaeon]